MTQNTDTEVQEVTTVSTPNSHQVVKQTKVVHGELTGAGKQDYHAKKVIFRMHQVIWYILGVIEVLLAFRIVLKVLGANPFSGFVNFVYMVSGPFALPFAGILGTTQSTGMVFEWSTVVAMIVYAVLAYGGVALFQLVKPTSPEEVEQAVDSQ